MGFSFNLFELVCVIICFIFGNDVNSMCFICLFILSDDESDMVGDFLNCIIILFLFIIGMKVLFVIENRRLFKISKLSVIMFVNLVWLRMNVKECW